MSNEQEVETTANPYNAKKSWHTPDQGTTETADGLFFERPVAPQATPDEALEESAPEKKQRTNYKKRYDDLKKHYDEKVSGFKQRELELQAATESTAPKVQLKTAEDLEAFRNQYPDLFDTVETVAHMKSEEQTKALQSKLDMLQERENTISRREAEETLRDRHPDFEDIRGDDSFHPWAKEQPEAIQGWIYDNPDNVQLAVKAIDLYKMEAGISTKGKRQTKASRPTGSAADMVSTKTTNVDTKEARVWTKREINALSMDEYDKHEQEIDRAVMEGRVR
tara:strand:- start:10341 stop:11180 length:840 start_codon:yes stop_codon:yes gene_type:complete